jgi:hypothetical protein
MKVQKQMKVLKSFDEKFKMHEKLRILIVST